ncbi:MAG: hypothetical protein K6B41_07390 [Butyrivibrio sp.]|nr:hypothetical protein [Butyrivibrio sp.]
MKTLYLHVGTPKTGTTAVQTFLYDNKEILLKNNFIYEKMPYHYIDASDRRNAHFLFKYIYNNDRSVNKEAFEKRLAEGYEIIKGWFEKVDNVFLTDEAAWNVLNTEGRDFMPSVKSFADSVGAQVKVIIYVRRQDDYLESWYKQKIRDGLSQSTWEEVAGNIPNAIALDYYKIIRLIANTIGSENIIVRRYDRNSFAGKDGTIFSDFMEVLGLDYTDEYKLPEGKTNTSLNNNYIEIKRLLNNLYDNSITVEKDQNPYLGGIGSLCSELDNQYDSSYFSEEERKEFLGRYKEGNDAIAKEFLGEEVLFNDKTKNLPKWDPNNEYLLRDFVVFCGMALKNQKTEIDELKKEVNRLKKLSPAYKVAGKIKNWED